MSKRTLTLKVNKRLRIDIYEDDVSNKENFESSSSPSSLSSSTRESRVEQLLLKASKHRGLTLYLIDRIRAGAHHDAR
jgi:hypothetical protein